MSYKLKLDIFEGPLDLLLYLIKREEINIYDIPIAKVTEQYLQYMELMKLLNLDVVGDFLVTAATLIQIKSKMLLPQDNVAPEEEEVDPRDELVRRLLEYKKFKEIAEELRHKEVARQNFFIRTASEKPSEDGAEEEIYFEASLFDLISAFNQALKDVPKELFYEVIK
ncbi:MAG: segregation/condensation protein A, partial [Candidatus Omnitrophota bacterium]|nr:segregation/condensation protein A [Candidatus Omnitrophota bacterium]